MSKKYNHCSLCGNYEVMEVHLVMNDKWLGFWSYLQFWQPIKICSNCEPKNLV